jgi:hypothetical protein
MEIYKNDYTKEEDEALWELHEIRRKVHLDIVNKSVEQINNAALEKFSQWKTQAKNEKEKVFLP